MRFFPLLALSALAPAFALESRELSGDWSCSTSYPALSARLDEHYTFRADGSAESDGVMTFFLKAGLLHYDVHSKDRWSLQDKALTIDIADYTIARAFKPRMVEILAESPELTAYEKSCLPASSTAAKTTASISPSSVTTANRCTCRTGMAT